MADLPIRWTPGLRLTRAPRWALALGVGLPFPVVLGVHEVLTAPDPVAALPGASVRFLFVLVLVAGPVLLLLRDAGALGRLIGFRYPAVCVFLVLAGQLGVVAYALAPWVWGGVALLVGLVVVELVAALREGRIPVRPDAR